MPSSALHSPVSLGGAGRRGYRIGSRPRVGGRCLAWASRAGRGRVASGVAEKALVVSTGSPGAVAGIPDSGGTLCADGPFRSKVTRAGSGVDAPKLGTNGADVLLVAGVLGAVSVRSASVAGAAAAAGCSQLLIPGVVIECASRAKPVAITVTRIF